MTILHLCNDYLGSTVHYELYSRLTEFKQIVYVPSRFSTRKRSLSIPREGSFTVVKSPPLFHFHRLFFNSKIKTLTTGLVRRDVLKEVDILHATTLFSDGAVAYKIFKEFGTPYIVTIRATDVGVFMKLRPDLLPLANKILAAADRVIFISEALKRKLFSNRRILTTQLNDKCEVIPNGVNEHWLNNRAMPNPVAPRKILYVGKILRRKNVPKLCEAVRELSRKYADVKLTIVGTGGGDETKVKSLAKRHPQIIEHLGAIGNRLQLQKVFREHEIFAMPSFNETFGLVYIEALSQGLPILYSLNEGVDGMVPQFAGEVVNPLNVKSIYEGLEQMIENYANYNLRSLDLSVFDWNKIAKRYISIYNNAHFRKTEI